MELPTPLIAALEHGMNQRIRSDLDLKQACHSLQGKRIGVHVKGLECGLTFIFHMDQLELLGGYQGEVNASVSALPLSLINLLSRRAGLEISDAEVSGDRLLVEAFLDMLPLFNLDWEAHLSQLTGGVFAHQLGNRVRRFQQEKRRGQQSMRDNIRDYLQEEVGLIPTSAEYQGWVTDRTCLDDRLAKLEKRINHLAARI
ncbi:MAG TPA: hypothetical protein DCZ12_04625 [Gammaproteobacteria bacterium]|nr:hypothetical protein [Gammaproteobacteria bacterium]